MTTYELEVLTRDRQRELLEDAQSSSTHPFARSLAGLLGRARLNRGAAPACGDSA